MQRFSRVLALVAVAVALTITAPAAATRQAHAQVFLPFEVKGMETLTSAACRSVETEDDCTAHGCLWCQSANCFTGDESSPCTERPFDHEWFATNTTATDALFTTWKRAYGKTYVSTEEERVRRATFEQHAIMVANHNNRQDRTFTMELNQFADLTWSEMQSLVLGDPQNCSATHTSNTSIEYGIAPDAKDWRRDGIVTRVKAQGLCGSCWAFSATGCLESHMAIKYGTQVLFSEQNLIDCAQGFENHGCRGGLPSQAFEYVYYSGGIDTEVTYRYKSKTQLCQFDERHVGAKVEAVVNITSRHEAELLAAVGTVGPVSTAFQARLDLMFYKSGVYESTQCHDTAAYVNHAVLAVGYGTTDDRGVPYWIVKNSWSAKWGSRGYFLIRRGVNMCGLADCASYAVVA